MPVTGASASASGGAIIQVGVTVSQVPVREVPLFFFLLLIYFMAKKPLNHPSSFFLKKKKVVSSMIKSLIDQFDVARSRDKWQISGPWLATEVYEHFLIPQLLFMARKKQAVLDRAVRAPSSNAPPHPSRIYDDGVRRPLGRAWRRWTWHSNINLWTELGAPISILGNFSYLSVSFGLRLTHFWYTKVVEVRCAQLGYGWVINIHYQQKLFVAWKK